MRRGRGRLLRTARGPARRIGRRGEVGLPCAGQGDAPGRRRYRRHVPAAPGRIRNADDPTRRARYDLGDVPEPAPPAAAPRTRRPAPRRDFGDDPDYVPKLPRNRPPGIPCGRWSTPPSESATCPRSVPVTPPSRWPSRA
ncbi:hypothetical protein KUTG_07352 [Kutzneria sp. 744]|nr:hypothetical protein KUTG_07352 [Kutzneria sp. 744]